MTAPGLLWSQHSVLHSRLAKLHISRWSACFLLVVLIKWLMTCKQNKLPFSLIRIHFWATLGCECLVFPLEHDGDLQIRKQRHVLFWTAVHSCKTGNLCNFVGTILTMVAVGTVQIHIFILYVFDLDASAEFPLLRHNLFIASKFKLKVLLFCVHSVFLVPSLLMWKTELCTVSCVHAPCAEVTAWCAVEHVVWWWQAFLDHTSIQPRACTRTRGLGLIPWEDMHQGPWWETPNTCYSVICWGGGGGGAMHQCVEAADNTHFLWVTFVWAYILRSTFSCLSG